MRFSHFAAHTTILTFPTFFFFRSRVVKTGGRIAMRLDFCYMTKETQKGVQNTSFVCALKDMLICRYVKTYNMRERSRKRGKNWRVARGCWRERRRVANACNEFKSRTFVHEGGGGGGGGVRRSSARQRCDFSTINLFPPGMKNQKDRIKYSNVLNIK